MRTSDKGVAALALHEGVVPAPYLDSVGVWTYGIGHTAAAGGPIPADMPRGMPDDLDAALARVFAVFRADLEKFEDRVKRAVKVPVAPHENDALVSFDYNTGGIFAAKLTKHLNAGNREAAAAAFMGWRRPPEIIPRRKSERGLFKTGTYPAGLIPVWGVNESGRVDFSAPIKTLTADDVIKALAA